MKKLICKLIQNSKEYCAYIFEVENIYKSDNATIITESMIDDNGESEIIVNTGGYDRIEFDYVPYLD